MRGLHTASMFAIVLVGGLASCAHLSTPLVEVPVNSGLSADSHRKSETGKDFVAVTPTAYYAHVPDVNGRALLAALHNLIAKHKDLGYGPARDLMFGQIDHVVATDQVVDVYSGRQFRGVTNSKSAYERGLNTEHSWCQSRGAKGAAKDDLHILFPVDGGTNSARGNKPFGTVVTVSEELPDFSGDGQHSVIGLGAGIAAGKSVFMPKAAIRGDVARAVLYFYTCYARFDNQPDPLDISDFKLEEGTMVQWSEQDPPTPAEINRNEAIYRAQGNRNPFVDHPEWIGRVGRFLP
jgi:deoxyribonuclease-1